MPWPLLSRRWTLALLACGVSATALTAASSALQRRHAADSGLLRTFFANPRFEGTPTFADRTTRLDLTFLDDRPELPRRRFSVRWQGTWHLPEAASVELFLGGDDRLRLYIDGELLLQRNAQLGLRTISTIRMLEAGPHDVRLDYVQLGGGYRLNVQWATAGDAARPLPRDRLFPTAPTPAMVDRSARVAQLRQAVVAAWAVPLLALLGFGVLPQLVRTARRTEIGQHRMAAATLFSLALAGYLANAFHFESIVFDRQQNLIFSADTWTTVGSMGELTFREHIRQHPIFSLVTNSVVELVQALSPIGVNRAILLTVALIAALNCTLFYLLLHRTLGSLRPAVVFTAIYALAFVNLAIFSIPETYPLSTTGVLLYLPAASSFGPALDRRALISLTGLAALAGLLNPPLLSLALIHLIWLIADRPLARA